ncbi:hypothetical protein N7V09_08655 [Shewanella seohaensis]|uniref:hypothetical protein n=1 Tax=Shewanella seohaensis TaxID=755175 RepID=UPI0020100405|nr:hypothetical protein [Shewanella seohaensis]MCL1119396.1 hypothetical protein [Shewanella seohaensis]UXM83534.1 hypothetical protein N7V09_08655 [Shewanella seohaensis]
MGTFNGLIKEALSKIGDADIYTFALYHDHESELVTVCIDTIESSNISLAKLNEYSMKYFRKYISDGDIKQAKLWQANIGRSLSLGDFKFVNIAEFDIEGEYTGDDFYLSLVNSIESCSSQIQSKSSHGKALLFCCSTSEYEVGLTWVPANA